MSKEDKNWVKWLHGNVRTKNDVHHAFSNKLSENSLLILKFIFLNDKKEIKKIFVKIVIATINPKLKAVSIIKLWAWDK